VAWGVAWGGGEVNSSEPLTHKIVLTLSKPVCLRASECFALNVCVLQATVGVGVGVCGLGH